MTSLITLSNVEKSYKDGFRRKKIIHDLSLDVLEGEVFGFIGPNGAGKSTVINLIMGFIKPEAGSVTINGSTPYDPRARQDIGYLPEDPRFYNNLSARELLLFGAHASGVDRDTAKKSVEPVLSRLDLLHVVGERVNTYSKGMKQRMGLAMAMVHDPQIYILDEPMSGLDPIGRNLLKKIILDLKDKGKTVFFSTHILNDVEVLCDRIGILNKGRLLFCGRIDEFSSDEKPFEEGFVEMIKDASKGVEEDG
jgi:ABC-2 type transport system ATP-binding protein